MVFTVDASSTGAGTISTRTVSGGTSTATLTVTTAGTIVLDANQAGRELPRGAQVQEIFVVNQATQTIAFNPMTTPLHYIASCSAVSLCATVTFMATGGGTDNLITLSADAGNAVISPSTAVPDERNHAATVDLMPRQTLNYPASLIIDGNQAGNANYSAATQAGHHQCSRALPLQTITLSRIRRLPVPR